MTTIDSPSEINLQIQLGRKIARRVAVIKRSWDAAERIQRQRNGAVRREEFVRLIAERLIFDSRGGAA